MFKSNILILFLIIIFAGVSFYLFLSKTYPDMSPFLTGSYYLERVIKPHAQLDKHVIGFLPYWRLDDMRYIRPELLSEINYFSLSVGNDGKLIRVTDGQTDPGWLNWQRKDVKNFITKAHIMGSEVSVTIAALDNELIENILDSDEAQTTLITDIIDQVKTRQVDSINIDFEYFGEADPSYKKAFTEFSVQLASRIKKEASGTELSISIMPLSARSKDLFDFPRLTSSYDRFIGMSYEYYGANSDIAGPIAPITGFEKGQYFFDVETTYKDFTKVIPKEKIVMGIPYYGWEWAVEDGPSQNSHTFPSDHADNYAAVISYARARESQDLIKKQCKWDTVAQETWCWYKDKATGVDRQAWIADDRSIKTRFDYAIKQNYDGVALWTLGYDKDYSDLWDLLHKSFVK